MRNGGIIYEYMYEYEYMYKYEYVYEYTAFKPSPSLLFFYLPPQRGKVAAKRRQPWQTDEGVVSYKATFQKKKLSREERRQSKKISEKNFRKRLDRADKAWYTVLG